jgi:hypothetical protein
MAAEPFDFVFTFGGDPQDLTVTMSGSLDAHGLHRLNHALMDDPRLRPGMAILVDLTGVDTSRLDEDELVTGVGPVHERDSLAPPRAVAIVATDPASFEKATHYRAHLGGSASHRRVFTDEAEALAWLRLQTD